MGLVGVALEACPVAERALIEGQVGAGRVGALVAGDVVRLLVGSELVVLLEGFVAGWVRAGEWVGSRRRVDFGDVDAEVVVLAELLGTYGAL